MNLGSSSTEICEKIHLHSFAWGNVPMITNSFHGQAVNTEMDKAMPVVHSKLVSNLS